MRNQLNAHFEVNEKLFHKSIWISHIEYVQELEWQKYKKKIDINSICIGPFTFTYNRGHGECRNPVSNIESCTEESRLLLNLQACPDVAGTESTGK